MNPSDVTITTATQPATRSVARCGWALLIGVGAALSLHGVTTYVILAGTTGSRSAGMLLAGVGLVTLAAAREGYRHGSRWAWNATWVTVAVLAANGAHLLLGGMRDYGSWHLWLAPAAIAGQILAAADFSAAEGEPSVAAQLRRAYPVGCAYAAGVIGIVANLQLVGFFLGEFELRESGGAPLGPANDLTGALYVVLMLPVAFALASHLSPGRATRISQMIGTAAMVVFASLGPMLVYEVVPFNTQVVIASAAAVGIMVWIALTSRSLRRDPTWSVPGTLGIVLGGLLAAALVVIVVSLLLPWPSLPQQILLAMGLGLGGLAWLTAPLWFLLVGRRLATIPPVPRDASTPGNAPAHALPPSSKGP